MHPQDDLVMVFLVTSFTFFDVFLDLADLAAFFGRFRNLKEVRKAQRNVPYLSRFHIYFQSVINIYKHDIFQSFAAFGRQG